MKQFIGIGNETPEQVLEILKANADTIEKGTYFRKCTPEELNERQTKICEYQVELGDLKEELDDVKKTFKAKMEPLEQDSKANLKIVRHKGEHIKGDLYKIVDTELGRVGFYNPQGLLVSERPIFEDERQTNIIGSIRDASGM